MFLRNDMCMREENRKVNKYFFQKGKQYSHQATQRGRGFVH